MCESADKLVKQTKVSQNKSSENIQITHLAKCVLERLPKTAPLIVQNYLAGQFRLRTMAVTVQVYLSIVKNKSINLVWLPLAVISVLPECTGPVFPFTTTQCLSEADSVRFSDSVRRIHLALCLMFHTSLTSAQEPENKFHQRPRLFRINSFSWHLLNSRIILCSSFI